MFKTLAIGFLLTGFLNASLTCAQEYRLGEPDLKLYIPPHAPQVRAVLLVLPGLGQDTRWASDATHFYTRLGRHYDVAVLGINQFYTYVPEAVDILLQRLDSLAKITGHRELSYVPLLVSGGSMGGGSSYTINHHYPERVVGFYGSRTHIPDPPEFNPDALKTPMLFNPGQIDGRYPGIVDLVGNINENGGMAALMLSYGAPHYPRLNDGLFWYGFSYLFDVMEKRYPFAWPQDLSGPVTLKDMDTNIALKADHSTWKSHTQIYPYDDYPAGSESSAYSILQDKGHASIYASISSWKDSTLADPYLQNEVLISGTGSAVILDQGSIHEIAVWSDTLTDIDSVFLYREDQLLKAKKGDSLFYSDSLEFSGWYCYHGRVKTTEGVIKSSTVYTVWSDGEPYNPQGLPTFRIEGELTAYEDFPDSLTASVGLSDATKFCRFTVNSGEIEFADVYFDSVKSKIVVKAIPELYGMKDIIITAEEEGTGKQFMRSITLTVMPKVQKFAIIPYVEYLSEFADREIPIKVFNPDVPSEYEVYKCPDFVECSVDTTADILLIRGIEDRIGLDSIIIRSWNPENPVREYFDTLVIKVIHNIMFSRPYRVELNMQRTVPDTFLIDPVASYRYDIDYVMDESEYFDAVYYGEGDQPAFLMTGKKTVEELEVGLTATEKSHPENTFSTRFLVTVVDEPTGIQTPVNDMAFRIYPNPAGDYLTIETRDGTRASNLRIYAIDGSLEHDAVVLDRGKHTISTSHLDPGMHILEIMAPDAAYRAVLLIQ